MKANKILDYAIKRINEYDKVKRKGRNFKPYDLSSCKMCKMVERDCRECPFSMHGCDCRPYKITKYQDLAYNVSFKEHQENLIEVVSKWAEKNTDYKIEVIK